MLRIAGIAALIIALSGAGLWWIFRLPPGPQPIAENFRLDHVKLIDPGRGETDGSSLAVANGRITPYRAGSGAVAGPVLDQYQGTYVMPGLVDMHTHLPPHTPLGLTEYFGLMYLLHGVTTLRVAGDTSGTEVTAARRMWLQSATPGPDIVNCGPFVSGENPRWKNSRIVRNPNEAEAVVEELSSTGVQCIKSYDDLNLESIHALVDAAAGKNIPVIGHVPFGLRIEEARIPDTQHLMGVAPPESILRGDHVMFRIVDWRAVDEARMREVVSASRKLQLAHTPTLVSTHQLMHYADYNAAVSDEAVRQLPRLYRDLVWHPEKGIRYIRGLTLEDHATIKDADEKKLKLLGMLYQNNVRLHLGTDTQQPFVIPGHSLLTEVRLFEEAGIPLKEVLAMATWRTAEGLGRTQQGSLEPGAPANFVIYAEDPTSSVDALDSLVAVSVGGRLYDRQELEAAKSRYLKHYEHPVVDWLSMFLTQYTLSQTVKRDY